MCDLIIRWKMGFRDGEWQDTALGWEREDGVLDDDSGTEVICFWGF